MSRPEPGCQRGSSTVLVVGLIAAVLTVTVAALAVSSAVRAAHVARSAADLGALAGAIAHQRGAGRAGACAQARRVAGQQDVRVTLCSVDAEGAVSVTTASPIVFRLPGVGPGHAAGRARAGPTLDEGSHEVPGRGG